VRFGDLNPKLVNALVKIVKGLYLFLFETVGANSAIAQFTGNSGTMQAPFSVYARALYKGGYSFSEH
jgi:hypothetical protein